jgi:hypothetical protein
MKFSADKVAFGRHETFHLRFAWLSKGFAAFQANADLFDDVDTATVTLGVGKNMVQAIRYWMRAAQLIDPVDNHPTALGEFLFDIKEGEDLFLEDQGTLWLLHWLLASNTEMATTIAWFFSKYHKANFDQNELRAALGSYLQESVKSGRRPAASTLKNDISVLTRLYAKTQMAIVAEDALDSPLSELGLIFEHGKSAYTSTFDDHADLPSEIVGFAILELMASRDSKILPVEELVHSAEGFVSPGSVFRLNEASFMLKLEELVRNYPDNFVLRETAGLRQLYLNESLSATDLLKTYYQKSSKDLECAA